MSDGRLLVTFGALSNAQTDTQQTYNQLNQQLADLQRYLAPLVAAWQGQAAEAYQAYQQRWNQAQDNLNQLLHQISGALGQALANYQTAERTNTSLWG